MYLNLDKKFCILWPNSERGQRSSERTRLFINWFIKVMRMKTLLTLQLYRGF